jgi:glutaredoxin 3
MMKVVMYSSNFCPFCFRAKALLKSKEVEVEERLVDGNAELRRVMMAESGQHTVPQIWIGDLHVGGCDDLYALERAGEIDKLLGVQSPS